MLDPYRMVIVNIISIILLGTGMLVYSKIYPKKRINLFVLLVIISILPLISLFRKGTYESGDLTLHSVFLRSFYESLSQGNFIPAWAENLCGSKGCPVFLFEYITPFYIGSLFHFIGFSYINSIKLLLGFSFIISGIGMYIFVKSHYGKLSAFVASLFYLFAPFHLSEMHFRVGIGMVLAFAFVPFLFLFTKKLVENKNKILFVILTSILLLLLITTHSSVTLLILPLLFLYTFIISKRKIISSFFYLSISIILGLGLSCFYWLPALKEIQYTWYLKDLTITDFKPIQEYLFSPILYGLLFQGHKGELRLIIGYPHLLVLLLTIYLLIKRKITKIDRTLILYSLISFLIYFFLLLNVSKNIWNKVPLLKSSVLPWRTLMPIAFITSFVSGLVAKHIKNKTLIILLCIFVISSTILNWGNRKVIPEDNNAYNTHWSLYTEYYEESNNLLRQNYVKNIALSPNLVLNKPRYHLEFVEGNGEIKELNRTSTRHSYILSLKSNSKLKDNTFYFPGWNVYTNYNESPIIYNDKDNLGLILFNLKQGIYKLDIVFGDSKIRKQAKLISLISFGIMGFLLAYYFSHKPT